MSKKIKTIFDGTNAEVMNAFEEMLQDVREIITDEEYPSLFVGGVDPNAPKAELGKAYVEQKVGQRMYDWFQVFLRKKPENIYNILDTIFCAKKGTYKNKPFKQTIKDLKSIDLKDLAEMLNFMRAVLLSK